MAPRYLVGIDLGTTNTAMAFVDLKAIPGAGPPKLETFPIPQFVAAGEIADRSLLPSFLYRPGEHDLPAGATMLPWDGKARDVIGEFARDHGAKVPGRLVASAKSWLCHPAVDRTAALLPWTAPPDVTRISPLEASARYLKHLADAWKFAHPAAEDHLDKLPIVLTVPASFDDLARTLTVEAAKLAGLPNVTLLEEPQGAFYCWRQTATPDELKRLQPGMTCLVIDVGGGTTDFSLIVSVEEGGELHFVRQAVGEHLLLGGDNMDLAIAREIEAKLPAGQLDSQSFIALVQACRRAKETLLGANPPDSLPVTVVGRGRSVVGGTVSLKVTRDDVYRMILDGFFPRIQPGDLPTKPSRAGLHEMGLPYVHDAAITRHLAAFLARHLPAGAGPSAVLFNGGVFQSAILRDHLLDVLEPWYSSKTAPIVLATQSLDLAVAHGAAAFAWIKHSGARSIGGGAARSYYVEVEHPEQAKDQLQVLCVVPRHLEEGTEIALPKPELDLAIGEPVVFPLFTSTARDDKPGDVLNVKSDQLRRLPLLHTIVRGGKRAGAGTKRVTVTLAAKTTAIGTLELHCVAKDGGHRWRLEFKTRDVDPPDDDDDSVDARPAGPVDLLPDSIVEAAASLIRMCFQGDALTPTDLTKQVEAVVENSRDDWPLPFCRRLFETLSEVAESRRQSPVHLSRWYNLVGFCMRPGFGDAMDRFRVESLWKTLHAPKPGGAAQPEPIGADAWIMWRRIAGGLTPAFQKTLFDRLRPALLSGKGKGGFRPAANELAEMWRAAASLERLDVKNKIALGEAVIKQIKPSFAPTYAFWSLARLGARELLYGPLNATIHPDIAAQWIEALRDFEPGHNSDRLAFGFCLAQLARRTGQRALDVDEPHRDAVLHLLKELRVPDSWPRLVSEISNRGMAERAQFFGDSLPIGLRLRQ